MHNGQWLDGDEPVGEYFNAEGDDIDEDEPDWDNEGTDDHPDVTVPEAP